MERAVFYARVSTEEEMQVNALKRQIEDCRKCVKDKKWVLAGEYIDEGKSGTTVKRRTEYQRLLDDIEAGKFDIIVVKSQDRLQRNPLDFYIFQEKVVRNGVKVWLYLENKYLDTDEALVVGIKAILASEYSRELSKKGRHFAEKNKEAAAKGEPFTMKIGRLYGFRKVEGGKRGAIEVVPEEAEVIRLVYNKYIELGSSRQVSIFMNENGYRTRNGKEFRAHTITMIIRNENYKGDYVLGRFSSDFDNKRVIKNDEGIVVVENAHEAIVDRNLWERANKIADEQMAPFVDENGNGKKRGKKTGLYPLSGKVYCATCGGVLWRHNHGSRNGKKYYGWKCSNVIESKLGKHINISDSKIRDAYKTVIDEATARGIEIDLAYMKKQYTEGLKALRAELSKDTDNTKIEKELEDKRAEKKKLIEGYTKGLYSDDDMKSLMDGINEQIERLERRLVPAVESDEIRRIDEVLANMDEEFEIWAASKDFSEKQIDFLIDHTKRITVDPAGAISINLDLLGGWVVVSNGVVGVIDRVEETEGKPQESIGGKEFMSFVDEDMSILLQTTYGTDVRFSVSI